MGILSSLYALADVFDPGMAWWSVELTSGKVWSEKSLMPTWKQGQKGVRKLDWLWDIVGTGDYKHIKYLTLHGPDGSRGVLEPKGNPVFQFRNKSVGIMGGGTRLEFLAVGQVISPAGWCECFIWDYYPKEGDPNLVAYRSNVNDFGAWRDTMTPLGALSMDVQGWRL